MDYDEESYGMNSEDDALFASVNMDDCHPEDGVGGPIHFDEGAGDGVSWDLLDDVENNEESQQEELLHAQAGGLQYAQNGQQDSNQQRPQVQAQRVPLQAQPKDVCRAPASIPLASGSASLGTPSSTASRPPPPSMGGFRFPVDMVSLMSVISFYHIDLIMIAPAAP